MKNEIIENTFKMVNKGIILRDMTIEDIDDYVIWNTNEIEWQDWDAPWETKDAINTENLKSKFFQRLNRKMPKARSRLEICTIHGEHVGWVTSYHVDGNEKQLAIGIDIPSNKFRGKKMGELAFTLFISYLLKSGVVLGIYTQTWSGNYRMVRLAQKCGFNVVNREVNFREIRGKLYDGLTFKLDESLFWNRFEHLK